MSYVTLGNIVLVGLFAIVGFLLCFLGYRLFRFSLFTVAFMSMSTLLLALFVYPTVSGASTPTAYWIGIVLVSTLCGFLAVTFPRAGAFIAGFCGGSVLLGLFVSVIAYSGSREISLLLLLAASIGGGFLALKHTKFTLIVTTSMFGATLLAVVVAYFVALWFTVTSYGGEDDYYYQDRLDSLGGTWGILFMILLILIGLGILIQAKVTGRGNHHESPSTRVETDAQQLEDGQGVVDYESLQTPTNGRVQCVDR